MYKQPYPVLRCIFYLFAKCLYVLGAILLHHSACAMEGTKKNYLEHHPRATGKHKQMRLGLTTGGAGVRGLLVDVTESEYRQERAFVDADEIGELLKGCPRLGSG